MIPYGIVYFAEYLINQGIVGFFFIIRVFDSFFGYIFFVPICLKLFFKIDITPKGC